MRSMSEIEKNPRISVKAKGVDGGSGIISLPSWKGTVIFSEGGGWEHVSVCPEKKNITPSWDDMCLIKDMFWNEDEAVIQVHPVKEEYVNNMPNCLHLWRCYYKEMVLPPSCFVGLKKGQTMFDLNKEIRTAYLMAGEIF